MDLCIFQKIDLKHLDTSRILHRTGRNKTDLGGEQQSIAPAFAMQAVDTIRHVATCLDDLIQEQMRNLRAMAAAQPQGAA